ncbi:MAG: alpha-mannosidase [Prochlorotrichaceae cyanobacterium]
MPHLNFAQSFLRQCNQRSLQDSWFAYADEQATDPLSDRPLALNDRGHIAWQKGRSLLCLGQDLVLPETWTGYPLQGLTAKLALTWWAESAIVFVNGQFVQEGDLFDCSARIILTDRVQGGECFRIRVRLISPGHDPGALVKSQWELEDLRNRSLPEPSWLADELAIVATYLQTHRSSELERLDQYCAPLLEQGTDCWDQLELTLATLREHLDQQWGTQIRQRHIHLLGHAHLDLAWLWPVAETWAAAERTFRSVLALQQEFPELIFAHSSPVLYHWLEQHLPDLFEGICQALQRGQWEAIAGLWVEPDTILPNGESLVRQVLYGQRYIQEHLGQRNRVAWLPDSFGFSAQLPQMLKRGGIDWFITQKLTWNDTTTFPHSLFQWQSTDGTIALALMSAPIGKGIEPLAMMQGAMDWEAATGSQDYLWLPGVGDHGGGPSRDMLETVRRWKTSPCFPQLGFSRLEDYLNRLEQTIDRSALPVWNQDLYLELHRGCYTSHGDQKQWNRQLEDLLYRAELWAAWAELLAGQPFPHQTLEEAWKLVLFNQFHDILPGSAIPEVFEQANHEWQEAQDLAAGILQRSLQTLRNRMILTNPLASDAIDPDINPDINPDITIVVFNSTPHSVRNPFNTPSPTEPQNPAEVPFCPQLVSIPTDWLPPTLLSPNGLSWQAWDCEGKPLPTQPGVPLIDKSPDTALAEDSKDSVERSSALLVSLPACPGVGYTQIHLRPTTEATQPPDCPVVLQTTETHYSLDNGILRVTIDRSTGQIQQLYSHILQRNLCQAPVNQLQCFQDQGQYWDAWNIDPEYEKHRLTSPQLQGCEVVEQGPLRASIRVCYQFQQSRIEQTYCLDWQSPVLKVDSYLNWHTDQVLLKVAFPWDFGTVTPQCMTESACGALERSTQPTNPREAAQWEIPLHRWLDLSTSGESPWGISVLNTGKYGADVQGTQLRLSLLRSPCWPDPQSDRGEHRFTYGIYPHAGSWQTAQTVTAAQILNSRLDLMPLELRPIVSQPGASLPARATLLSLGSPTLQLMSFHPHLSQPGYVLRCYESAGQATTLQIQLSTQTELDSAQIYPLNGLEELEDEASHSDRSADSLLTVTPWQIRSVLLKI